MTGETLSEEDIRRITAVLLSRAARARLNLASFFQFVVREEHTRAPIKTAPHQRLVFEFMEAHPLCVVMLPIGHTKTYSITSNELYELGQDRSSRSAFISYTQAQAAKPLGMVRDYIEQSQELRLVFPQLVPSSRGGDSWSQTEITVERPFGIRDPSIVAAGMDSGAIPGSRIKRVYVDDILNRGNTATKDQRDKVYNWVDTSVLSRLDPKGGRCVVTNTPWHPKDLLHRLRDDGWPTLRMEIGGDIEFYNTGWDPKNPDDLRPAGPGSLLCRLTAHDPDPHNEVPLFPHRIKPPDWFAGISEWYSSVPDKLRSELTIETLRKRHLPVVFNQLYRCIARDDESSMCRQEYIDCCLKAGREALHFQFLASYEGPNQTFTGVDLAVSPGEEHDDTSFFTFEVLPTGHRRILEIEVGQWPGPEIVKKIIDKARRYKSVIRVENNAAQDYIRQFTLNQDISIPVKAHCTGRAKAHPEHGVPGLFIELSNGAWLIPNTRRGEMHPAVKRAVEACLYYSPTRHTDDVLMSWYFAREQAREFGLLSGSDVNVQNRPLGLDIMAR